MKASAPIPGVSPTFSLSGFASSSDRDFAAPHQAQGQPLERLIAWRSLRSTNTQSFTAA